MLPAVEGQGYMPALARYSLLAGGELRERKADPEVTGVLGRKRLRKST